MRGTIMYILGDLLRRFGLTGSPAPSEDELRQRVGLMRESRLKNFYSGTGDRRGVTREDLVQNELKETENDDLLIPFIAAANRGDTVEVIRCIQAENQDPAAQQDIIWQIFAIIVNWYDFDMVREIFRACEVDVQNFERIFSDAVIASDWSGLDSSGDLKLKFLQCMPLDRLSAATKLEWYNNASQEPNYPRKVLNFLQQVIAAEPPADQHQPQP